MSLKKRFWTDVAVTRTDGGFGVLLDTHSIRTPAGRPFLVPSRGLAEEVAAEWQAQEHEIAPLTMPMTRLCNSAIERINDVKADVVEVIGQYGETDLICHRAETTMSLSERQAKAWDPVLDWLRRTHGIALVQTVGVLPVEQPQSSIEALKSWLAEQEPFAMMAIHDLVTLSGSIVLARAVAERAWSAEDAWECSRIDETWQAEQWGEDDEAARVSAQKRADFLTAARMLAHLDGA